MTPTKPTAANDAPPIAALEDSAEPGTVTLSREHFEALVARLDALEDAQNVTATIAEATAPRELSERERSEVHRAYNALRGAKDLDEAAEARDRIRAVLGEDAEIGDHVIVLANGNTHRVEVPHGTNHNNSTVVNVIYDPQ